MKTIIPRFKKERCQICIALLFLVSFFRASSLSAAIITSTAAGGNWNTGATWVGGNIPAVGDQVVIATSSGGSVTLIANQTCTGVTINSGAILNLSSFTLTVNGPWQNNGTFNDGTGTVTFGTANAAINAGSGTANFENIIIASGATMNINTDVAVNGNFDFVLPAANNIVNINLSNSLSVSGNLTMNLPTATRTSTIAVGAGTLTVSGLFNMQAQATSGRANVITISTGTANLNGGYSTGTVAPTIAAGCKITFTDAGILNLSGTLTGGAPAIVQSTGTVNFKSATAQGIWLETYYNLGVFDGTKSLLGAITVQNQLNVASGTLQAGSFAMTLSGSANAFICAGTFNPGSALVTMSGAAETTIPGTTFNNLTVTGGNKTVQSGTMLTVNGNWAQNTSVVMDGTANAYVGGLLSGYGALTMGSGTLSLDSSYTSSGTFTPGTGTIKYIGNGGAVKVNWTYYNLEIDGNRSITGAVTVTNVLTVNSGKTLSMGTSPVNLTGDGNPIVNNGTIVSTSGALVFAGTGAQVIGSGTYPKTTLTGGSKTIPSGANVNIAGAFAITAPLTMEANSIATITGAVTMSSPLIVENSSTFNVNGTFVPNADVTYNGNASGTFTGAVSGSGGTTMSTGTLTFQSTFAGGTFDPGTGRVVYDGTAAQAVRVGINYYNLELSSSVSNSIASGTLNIANNLIIESATTLTTSTTLNITNDITGTGAFTAAGFVNLQGDWLHTGTLTPGTGTIHYNGTDQIVKSLSYYKLSMTGGTKTMDGNITATNLVTINAATILNMAGFTLELQGGTVNALSNLGTLTGNGKVKYAAAGAQTVNASVFYDLEFTGGDKTIATGVTIETTNDWIVSSNVIMTSTQNVTVGRDLIHNTGALIDQGAGVIRIGRNWTANGGTFDAATGTVIYEGANQTIAPFSYATLICDGTGIKSITGNIIITGVLTINPGVTFDRDTYNVTLSYNGTPFVNNGTLTGNGKFFYTGTGTQNIAPGSYYDLEFNTGAKNLPANEALEILNDWTISSVTVFGENTTVSVSGNISGAGAFTLGNGTLNLAGSWDKTGTFTASNTGIFHYNGAAQNIAALDYYKLQISNPGVKSLAANTTVRDVLTVNSGSTLGLGAFTLTLPLAGTPFINQGTMLPGTSTVLYTAASQTEIAPGSYYNLTTSGGPRSLVNGGTYEIGGTFTPGSPTFTSVTGSTVNFNGTAAQTIPAFTFHKLILSGANDKSVLTATSVTVFDLEVQDTAVLNIAGTGVINITKP
ncbi:MAG: beta strand repeat-containing protein [Daejeonella sp.]|uniref:beta strand repeat-containing protein n=1 Tax=Daejeonella sp. JGW-45 TaxID=3034148 RepID=UPI0023EAC947|nr:hypothetical protein [Daejeonella sp. JGW-45]